MAQSFSVAFPPYFYDVQIDREITFPNKNHLPFTILQDKEGHLFVQSVDEKKEGDAEDKTEQELVPGLLIVSVNDEDIVDKKMNQDAFEELLNRKDDDEVTMTFREDLDEGEDSHIDSLGLAQTTVEEEKEEKTFLGRPLGTPLASSNSINSSSSIRMSALPGTEEGIKDDCIMATSYEKGFEAHQCRLNGPSCWKPRKREMSSITIDLRTQKQITKILFQGNNDHTEFCKMIWMDYSRDGAEWRSWGKHEITLKYEADKVAVLKVWPVLATRFIRIRPVQWKSRVALRMELLGIHSLQIAANLHNARIISLSEIEARKRAQLLKSTANLPPDTRVIQVDCKAVIKHALDLAGVRDVSFIRCQSQNGVRMAVFTTKDGEESERTLDNLHDVGVGKQMGTISVMSVEYRSQHQKADVPEIEEYSTTNYAKKDNWFSKSIKSRKFVQTMIDRVMGNAHLTFDYVVMLCVASCIALGGLATDNAVIIVASMLVSPIMGPVMALTLGITLKQPHMVKIGLKNEAISLAVCIIVGFVFGLTYAGITANYYCWPTSQMRGRGLEVGLADGAFIAAVSGIGVALCVLGDYAATIIGVAISASLLPPAVNCGMMLAFALYEEMNDGNSTFNKFNDGTCTEHVPREMYSVGDMMQMSILSFVLTIENIVIIVFCATFMFKVKQVVKVEDKNAPLWKSVTNFAKKHDAIKPVRNRWGDLQLTVLHLHDPIRRVSPVGTRWIMEKKMSDTMKKKDTIVFPKRLSLLEDMPTDHDTLSRLSTVAKKMLIKVSAPDSEQVKKEEISKRSSARRSVRPMVDDIFAQGDQSDDAEDDEENGLIQ